MKLAAAVLTRNQYEHERRDLFERTVHSLQAASLDLYVIDNGSTDGTDKHIQTGKWTAYCSTDTNTTSGFGTWLCCRILAGTDADILIVSDDDMEWTPGFVQPLIDWWQYAPDELALTGAHLEPSFHWNAINQHVVYGNTHGLLRQSTGAASWTFRNDRYERLAYVARTLPIDRQGTWDVPMCASLRNEGWTIGQLDLAEHIGQGRSTWGNGTEQLYGWDIEPIRASL